MPLTLVGGDSASDNRTVNTLSSPWDPEIDAWCRELRAAGRPATTIRLRGAHLRTLARAVGTRPPWQLERADLVDYLGSRDWQIETRRSVRASIRGFYDWGAATGRTPVSPALSLPAVPRRPPAPHPADDDAYHQALTHAQPREHLMLRLAAEAGLRRGEVACAHSADLFRDLLGWSLVVHGKGQRERVVPVTESLAAEVRGRGQGFLFPGADHGHLSAMWVGKIIGRLLPAGVSMHALRHRFATRAFAVNENLAAVQDLLGHSSPKTTRYYVRVDSAAARRIVETMNRPAA